MLSQLLTIAVFAAPLVSAQAEGRNLPVGWNYTGCYRDFQNARILPFEYKENSCGQSAAACITHCQSKGYTLAGTQNGTQCWCGHDRPQQRIDGQCNQRCSCSSGENCGGSLAAHVYGRYQKPLLDYTVDSMGYPMAYKFRNKVPDPHFENGLFGNWFNASYATEMSADRRSGISFEGRGSLLVRPNANVANPRGLIYTSSLDFERDQYTNITFYAGRRATARPTVPAFVEIIRYDYRSTSLPHRYQDGDVVFSWQLCGRDCELRGTFESVWQRMNLVTPYFGGALTANTPDSAEPENACRDEFSMRLRIRWEGVPDPDQDTIYIDGVSANYVESYNRTWPCGGPP